MPQLSIPDRIIYLTGLFIGSNTILVELNDFIVSDQRFNRLHAICAFLPEFRSLLIGQVVEFRAKALQLGNICILRILERTGQSIGGLIAGSFQNSRR